MPKIQTKDYFKYPRYLDKSEPIGYEGFSRIKPSRSIPEHVVSFNEWRARRYPDNLWVDHFIDDRLFDCVYKNCDKYLPFYKKLKGVIGTDFSAYRDMPAYHRKVNVGKNREIDNYLQNNGVNVIPVVSYAYMEDFSWCLDGLPMRSSIAISTNGSMANFISHEIFVEGAKEVQRRLQPFKLIVAGGPVRELDELFDNIVYYPNFSQRLRERRKNG